MVDMSQEEKKEIARKITLAGIRNLQKRLAEWQSANFEPHTTTYEWMLLGAVEEIGEISHVLVKAKQKIRQHQAGLDKTGIDAVADGVADTCVYLMQLCTKLGIDFGEVLFNTAEEVMKRNWVENKKDGVNE